MYAKQIMYSPKFSVTPDTKFQEVMNKWIDEPCDVPVLNDKKEVVGLITAKQIIRHIVPDYLKNGYLDNVTGFSDLPHIDKKVKELLDKPVKEIMKTDFNWAYEDESTISIALKLINKNKCIRTIVVMDRNKQLMGLIDAWSIIKRLVKEGNIEVNW